MASLKTFANIDVEGMNRENYEKTNCKDEITLTNKIESIHPGRTSSRQFNIKHIFTSSTCCTESNSGSHSYESKKFVIQSLIAWLIICIPGNVAAGIILYKHYVSENSTHDKSHHGDNRTNISDGIPKHKTETVQFVTDVGDNISHLLDKDNNDESVPNLVSIT